MSELIIKQLKAVVDSVTSAADQVAELERELAEARAQMPKCNGMCLRASDVLDDLSRVVGNPVARAHRSCPKHGDLEAVARELDAALTEAETERNMLRARLTGVAIHAHRLKNRTPPGESLEPALADLFAALEAPAQATTEEKTDG